MKKKIYNKPIINSLEINTEQILSTSITIQEWNVDDEWNSREYDVFEF